MPALWQAFLVRLTEGYIELRPANDDYPVFRIDDPEILLKANDVGDNEKG